MQSSPNNLSAKIVPLLLLAEFIAASLASAQHRIEGLPPLMIGSFISGGIVAWSILYFITPGFRPMMERAGLRTLTAAQGWRIAPGLWFLWYGTHGLLATTFAQRAGWGDVAAGVLGLFVAAFWPRPSGYWAAHLFGLTDLAIALYTGLTLTLQNLDQMRAVTEFPLALIPFFGVAITGASHIVAFDLLLRRQKTRVRLGRMATGVAR